MYHKLHSHTYRSETTRVFEHTHKLSGTTTKNPDFYGHVHYMSGYTTEDNDHVHYYSVTTGPGIEVEGGHFHFYQGFTTINDRHYHFFYGHTSIHTDY